MLYDWIGKTTSREQIQENSVKNLKKTIKTDEQLLYVNKISQKRRLNLSQTQCPYPTGIFERNNFTLLQVPFRDQMIIQIWFQKPCR